ncbi:MAG: hypothetical protein ACXABI_08600 [Candidatus Hodarchaeales archaeon]|jgi:hypothetical protein
METAASQIRLFGPGISVALRKLEELTIGLMSGKYPELVSKIMSGKPYIGEEADYQFIWKDVPKKSNILFLIELIDNFFKENDAKYTITTLLPGSETDSLIYDFNSPEVTGVAYTFLRIYGPCLGEAIRILDTEIAGKIDGIQPDSRGVLIGKFDYVIEWLHIIPMVNDIINLLDKIDLALKKSGVTYSVTTRSKLKLHTDPRDKDKPKQILQVGAPAPSLIIDTGK